MRACKPGERTRAPGGVLLTPAMWAQAALEPGKAMLLGARRAWAERTPPTCAHAAASRALPSPRHVPGHRILAGAGAAAVRVCGCAGAGADVRVLVRVLLAGGGGVGGGAGTGIEDYFNSGFAFSFFDKIFHNDLSGKPAPTRNSRLVSTRNAVPSRGRHKRPRLLNRLLGSLSEKGPIAYFPCSVLYGFLHGLVKAFLPAQSVNAHARSHSKGKRRVCACASAFPSLLWHRPLPRARLHGAPRGNYRPPRLVVRRAATLAPRGCLAPRTQLTATVEKIPRMVFTVYIPVDYSTYDSIYDSTPYDTPYVFF